MFSVHLKSALKSLTKEKWYTAVNVISFSLALACSFLILQFIAHEISFDRFHENKERIYRVVSEPPFESIKQRHPIQMKQQAEILRENYPEIEETVRIYAPLESFVQANENTYQEDRLAYTDPAIFRVFSFGLAQGDPTTALANPTSAVISPRIAQKYFGDEDAIGKKITLNNGQILAVTAVLENIPGNSHLLFDILLPYSALPPPESMYKQQGLTYLLLNENASCSELQLKMLRDKEKLVWWLAGGAELYLQPLTKIHLDTNVANSLLLTPNRDKAYLLIAAIIGLAFLLVSCFNYYNLSIAKSFKSIKQVGVQKILGANKRQLFMKYIVEALLLTGIASIIAFGLFELVLPFFNATVSANSQLYALKQWYFILAFAFLWLLTGVISGSYPAFALALHNPILALKGIDGSRKTHLAPRKYFITFQYTVSIILIVFTIVIISQVLFIQNKNLGYDTDHLMIVNLKTKNLKSNFQAVKQECLNHSGVLSASASYGSMSWGGAYGTEALINEKKRQIMFMFVDDDFWSTAGATFVYGGPWQDSGEAVKGVVVNNAVLKAYGLSDPVGEQIDDHDTGASIVTGVVNDMFSLLSFYEAVAPTFYHPLSDQPVNTLLIRIQPQNMQNTLDHIKTVWQKFEPFRPLDYKFINDEFDQYYRNERKLLSGIVTSAILMIFVACLGGLGLMVLISGQRTKEIGVRKVLGANVAKICGLLVHDVTKSILVANVLAWPVAWYAVNKWLQHFAYRIDLTIWPFLLAGLTALGIALLTVSWQVIRAARANPVEALRYE